MMSLDFCILVAILLALTSANAFVPVLPTHSSAALPSSSLKIGNFFNFGSSGGSGGKAASIPTSTDARDKAAIESCKQAIERPRNKDCPLIELEFPALAALNKLGDGSLRSAIEAEDANLAFVGKLARGISSPFGSTKVSIVLSASATNSFRAKATKSCKGLPVLSASSPSLEEDLAGVAVFVSPASRGDYTTAQQLARSGAAKAIVVVNAFAKDPRSIPGDATMAYFLKPLTYNSQVAGFLVRSYPSDWTVLDASTKEVLGTFSDQEILVPKTNTPDLRASGKMVQKSVDERAIANRNNNR